MLNKIINIFLRYLTKFTDNFFTFHSRPKYVNDMYSQFNESDCLESNKIAIVIQGPLMLENSFTLETIKLYLRYFSNHKLILSTWVDSDAAAVKIIKDLGVEIILNEKPLNGGIANINYQIISTSRGIMRAQDLGYEYVLKTRTDQRVYAKEVINFCYAAIKQFPLLKKFDQNERIISFSMNTFKYRPYSVSDMINFGNIDDMYKYWCLPLDTRSNKDLLESDTLLGWSKQKLAEVYFVSSFLNNINRDIKWTLRDSWDVMKENFCILNIGDIDLYWHKYGNKEFRHRNYNSDHNKEFNFSDWLSFQNKFPDNIPENIIISKID